jgi:hypothetical protein
MRGVILESASLQPNQSFNVQPFRLDSKTAQEPTLFEAAILLDGVRYQYGFEFTSTRIVGEWLLVYQTAKPQKWFERKWDPEANKETFEFGPHLTGAKRLWQDSTRPNALFLSVAVQLNSEALAPLHQWFAQSLNVYLEGGQLAPDFSTSMLQTSDGQKRITAMMASADFAISSISAVPTKGFSQSFQLDPSTGHSNSKFEETEFLFPRFKHTSGDVTAEFDIGDESQGTQKMFALAGPLFDILDKGRVLVIDELDRSLHPLLVRQIIKTFQDPELNCKNAQLIFTTHDTAQLDGDLIRRDQIWFTEKGRDQGSELVSLASFSARKDEAFEKRYLDGRYGGVPILSDHLLVGSDCGEG